MLVENRDNVLYVKVSTGIVVAQNSHQEGYVEVIEQEAHHHGGYFVGGNSELSRPVRIIIM